MSKDWEKAMYAENPASPSPLGEEFFSDETELPPQSPQAPSHPSNPEKLTTFERVILKGIQEGNMEIELKPVADARKQKRTIKLFGNKFEATIRTKKATAEAPLPEEEDDDAIPEDNKRE
ncbi:MAG: hypothetical protein HWN68_07710 [Desulfobacterales bacterium]|nr:hypothetical protein [Desulfobacterales bacterium]